MGSIADKLEYLRQTKEAIRIAINNKGVTVTENDTFRSYANKIGNITQGTGGESSLEQIYTLDPCGNFYNWNYVLNDRNNIYTSIVTSSGTPYANTGTSSGTTSSASVTTIIGATLVACFFARDTVTSVPDGWTLRVTNTFTEDGQTQTLYVYTKTVTEGGTYTFNITVATSARIDLTLIALYDLNNMSLSSSTLYELTNNNFSITVPAKENSDDCMLWVIHQRVWGGTTTWATSPNDISSFNSSSYIRLGVFVDFGTGSSSRTFTSQASGKVGLIAFKLNFN